ncbi:MAG TPA: hypothetical protein VI454_00360, partial [Verrucomicrobiae bacterium]
SEEVELRGIPFPEVIFAATGKRVLPFSATNDADRALLAKLGGALDRVVAQMNAPDSPAHRQKRINEVSTHFERALRDVLNTIPGFACDWPKTAAGRVQHSGYPDLRLEDKTTGRILYLDPKLYEAKSRASSFRTFYYEPKRDTNKVRDDAHHFIVGFAHTGKSDGRWQFVSWELVDVSRLRVQLKAEFQASNRDLYREEAIVSRSERK